MNATRRVLAMLSALLASVACTGQSVPEEGTRIADVEATLPRAGEADGTRSAARSGVLARSAGGRDGASYRPQVVGTPGMIIGTIDGGSPIDTSVTPTHDLGVCRPFSESLVPSRDGGVGNAVVWLSGVSSGPQDTTPRRVKLTLDGCRLTPRVQRVAPTGTVLVSGRDAMMSRLRFTGEGESAPRATVLLSDAGQVVPTDAATGRPGLVRVSDDLHPWVRSWLVIAPHPFVAITGADGAFRFDSVPAGRYTLHVWQERLGTREQRVRVAGGVQVRVTVGY